MSTSRLIISGLHRGENPQPGAGIVRSIRRVYPEAYIVGLVYDALESGIYVEGGPDAVYAMPYPTSGAEAFFSRLDEVLARVPADIFIPTLDAEIELLVHLQDKLTARGLKFIMPDKTMLQRRAKQHLTELATTCDVAVPETAPVFDIAGAYRAAMKLEFPLMVKGQYYDAKRVDTEVELAAAVSRLLAEWGAPAILQRCIHGPEFNVLGLGDGQGGVLGLCALRKTVLSEKGKGLGGMTVNDKRLTQLCERVIRELRWLGPFEIEVMLDEKKSEYCLIEINPRFPAWVDFPSMCGANFAGALLERLATGAWPAPLPTCPAGHFYLRHQIEVHGRVDQLAMLTTGAGMGAA
ncbi:MAG: ATP-grasp domain-containing protein [Roseimicrobium sp.]